MVENSMLSNDSSVNAVQYLTLNYARNAFLHAWGEWLLIQPSPEVATAELIAAQRDIRNIHDAITGRAILAECAE